MILAPLVGGLVILDPYELPLAGKLCKVVALKGAVPSTLICAETASPQSSSQQICL